MPITKASSSAVAPAAKGDLVVGNATNDSGVLAVGSTDQVLTVDSSTATGLKWATASAGGMTLLSTTTLSGTSTAISNINQSYNYLHIEIRNVYANVGTQLAYDFSTNQNGTSGLGMRYSNGTTPEVVNMGLNSHYNMNTTSSATTMMAVLRIYNYASTTQGKHVLYSGSLGANKHAVISGFIDYVDAVDQVRLFAANGTSTFTGGTVLIYGVK